MSTSCLLAPMKGAEHLDVNGVQADIVKAVSGRVKRMIYPPGMRWNTHLKHLVKSDVCMHAHVGFPAQAHLQFRFSDCCIQDFVAPQVVVVEPGHDA